jgi:hypothetical protein
LKHVHSRQCTHPVRLGGAGMRHCAVCAVFLAKVADSITQQGCGKLCCLRVCQAVCNVSGCACSLVCCMLPHAVSHKWLRAQTCSTPSTAAVQASRVKALSRQVSFKSKTHSLLCRYSSPSSSWRV